MKLFIFFLILFAIGMMMLLFMKQSNRPTGLLGGWMINIWNRVYTPLFIWALKIVPLRGSDIVLDIGIGGGVSTSILAKNIFTGKIFGIDYSDKSVELAIKRNREDIEVNKVTILKVNVEKLPFKEDYFTIVTAFQTHFHWENLNNSLREIYRVLASQGILVLACELSKVSYYTKEFINKEYASNYFKKIGFTDIVIDSSKNWICFSMRKI